MKSKLFKSLLLVVAAIALVVTTVFATMAYMTGKATVLNTFTVGSITLDLYESKTDDQGNGTLVENGGTTTANKYHLIPDKQYIKDPTVKVTANSDPCYLFVRVQNGIKDIEATTNTIESQIAGNGWKNYTTVGTDTVYVYHGLDASNVMNTKPAVIEKMESDQTFPVFGTFTTANTTIASTYSSATVTITAYAVQTAGFETIDDAWEALVDDPNIKAGV